MTIGCSFQHLVWCRVVVPTENTWFRGYFSLYQYHNDSMPQTITTRRWVPSIIHTLIMMPINPSDVMMLCELELCWNNWFYICGGQWEWTNCGKHCDIRDEYPKNMHFLGYFPCINKCLGGINLGLICMINIKYTNLW